LTLFPARYGENCETTYIFRNTYFFSSKLFFSFFLRTLIGWKFDRFQVRLVSIYKKNFSSIGPQGAKISFWVGGALNIYAYIPRSHCYCHSFIFRHWWEIATNVEAVDRQVLVVQVDVGDEKLAQKLFDKDWLNIKSVIEEFVRKGTHVCMYIILFLFNLFLITDFCPFESGFTNANWYNGSRNNWIWSSGMWCRS